MVYVCLFFLTKTFFVCMFSLEQVCVGVWLLGAVRVLNHS